VAFNDAIRVAKDDLAEKKNKGSEDVLNSLKNYASHLKVTKTIERNLLLSESLEQKLESSSAEEDPKKRTKPDELIKVYDNLLQNIHELSELVTGDAEQAKFAAAQALSFKALRCYYLSLSYFNASKWTEALGLLDRAKDQLQSARTHHEACANVSQPFLKKLDAIDSKIRAYKFEAHARSFLQTAGKQEPTEVSAEAKGSLLESINRFDYSYANSKHLITFPPQFESTKCKPLFFDLAFSGVEFPSLEARKKGKGGWFGFWR